MDKISNPTKTMSVVAVLIATFVFGRISYIILDGLYRQHQTNYFASTQGVVEKCDARSGYRRTSAIWDLKIAYEVNGKKYSTHEYRFYKPFLPVVREDLRQAKLMPVGSAVTIYYDPIFPEISVATAGLDAKEWWCYGVTLGIVGTMILLAWGGAVQYGYFKRSS